MSINIGEILLTLWNDSGFAAIISGFMSQNGHWAVMYKLPVWWMKPNRPKLWTIR